MDEPTEQNPEAQSSEIKEPEQKKKRRKLKAAETTPSAIQDESAREEPKPVETTNISFEDAGSELLGPIDEEEIDKLVLTAEPEAVRPAIVKPKRKSKPRRAAAKIEQDAQITTEVSEIKSEEEQAATEIKEEPDEQETKLEISEPITEITPETAAEKQEASEPQAAAPAEPETPPVQQPAQPEGKKRGVPDSLKWFSVGVLIVILFIGVYSLLNNLQTNNVPSNTSTLTTGMAVYEPTDLLKDWKLVDSKINLAEIPSDLRLEWITQGVQDAAMWKYQKSGETVYIWIRTYSNKTVLEENDFFKSPLFWRTYTHLGIGDGGIVGIYKDPAANDPLLVYAHDDAKLLYISYYNENSSRYNASEIFNDERFLVSLARQMLAKFGDSQNNTAD